MGAGPAAQMLGFKLGCFSPHRLIQTCMEWQKCTFSTNNLHATPSSEDDQGFDRALVQPTASSAPMKAGRLHCHETRTAYLGLSGEGSQVWCAGCSSSTAVSTKLVTGGISVFSYKIHEASLCSCMKEFSVRQISDRKLFQLSLFNLKYNVWVLRPDLVYYSYPR